MLQECTDELLLLSDMLGSFSRSDGGVTRAHAESISKRMRAVADRLRSGSGARHTAPSVTAAPTRDDQPVAGAVPHPPVASNAARATAAPPTSSMPNESSSVSTAIGRLPTVRQQQSPRGPDKSGEPTGPPTSRPFVITKPNSVRVAPIPRETLSSGPSFDACRAAACSLYNILENVTWLMESTTASVYVREGDEMVSIVNVNPKLVFPPKLLRHACHGSLSAGVLASGISLNQRTVDPRRPPTSTLIVPIYNETGAVASTPIAVVQVEGKHHGRLPYTEADELNLCFGARILGLVISRFHIDWQSSFHDPMSQHNLAPFRPAWSTRNAALLPAATGDTHSPESAQAKDFAEALDGFSAQKFVKRVVLPMSQSSAPERVVGLGPAPTLKEIDSYVNNLHDCWKKSVEMNVSQSHAERQKTKEIKQLREEVSQLRTKHTQAVESLRIHELDSSDYKQEYQTLRQELEAYLRSKDRMD